MPATFPVEIMLEATEAVNINNHFDKRTIFLHNEDVICYAWPIECSLCRNLRLTHTSVTK